MKGLILAGGVGSRLRPITHTSAKQLVPIANKPIIFYGIEQLAAAGIKHIGIVVGETGAEIRAAVGDGSQFGVEVTYIEQDAPRGLADCVLIASDFLGDDDFVMYLGDNMLQDDLRDFVDRFHQARDRHPELGEETAPPAAQILLAHVDDPRNFGVVELDVRGDIVRLIEKPANPPSDLALVGVYLFSPLIHDAVRAIEPSDRDELEITDAIQHLLDEGHGVAHEILQGWWIDTGKKDPLLHCNRLVLDTIEHRVDGHVDDRSHVERRVIIEEGAQLIGSVVRGPAIIGARTRLVDTYVGPYTSIAADCVLIDAEIEHSVVLENSRIEGVHRIQDSLLGRSVEVERTRVRPHATRLMLGDHSRADLEQLVKLLVTGGAGFIGSNYVRHVLAHTDDEVTVYDALTYAGNLSTMRDVDDDPRYRFVKGNICDPGTLEEAMAGVDAVVHFAAESHVDRSIAGPDDFINTNCFGTNILMDTARRLEIERVVHIGTDEVYGSVELGSSKESDPLEPRSPYSASKAGSDLIALSYHYTYGLPVVVTRCTNNFGPFQYPEKAIPLFTTNLLDGLRIPLYGDGLNERDWLFVDDHCAGVQLALHQGVPGEIYNIGAGNETPNRVLVDKLLGLLGCGEEMVEYVTDRLGHDRRYSVDIAKITELGWRKQRTLDEALEETVAWYRDNRWWWEPLKAKA